MKNTETLCLSDLEAFDGRAPGGSGNKERRFCCPFCGSDKPRDAGHRSLCASLETGAFHCHRCDARGKLRDFWQERPAKSSRERAGAFFAPPITPNAAPVERAREVETGAVWRSNLAGLQPLEGTPGAAYLTGRGLSVDLCERARVRFAPAWFGRPAAVFPSRDAEGALIGAQGRYTDGRETPKTRTAGTGGAFWTPGALDARTLAIVEAPIDALSLAMAGVPALALFGCNFPAWLPNAIQGRRILIASDADEAGDKAGARWAAKLSGFFCTCWRLRPDASICPDLDGVKDWNGALSLLGALDLRELLSMALD